MKNLLSADYKRLFKHKIFWISVIFVILSAVYSFLPQVWNYNYNSIYDNYASEDEKLNYFNSYYFLNLKLDNSMRYDFAVLIVICIFLTCIFIASEFSTNVIRNKVIAGYTHTQIFFSYLIVLLSVEFILHLIFLVVYSISIPFLMSAYKRTALEPIYFQASFTENIMFQLEGLAAILALSTMFLMFVLLFRTGSKSSIAIVIILAFFILFTERVTGELYDYTPLESNVVDIEIDPANEENRVVVEEFDPYDGYGSLTAHMESIRGKNLSKTKYAVYSFCEDASPIYQVSSIFTLDKPSSRIMICILYDILFSVLFCLVGILSFRFNELN